MQKDTKESFGMAAGVVILFVIAIALFSHDDEQPNFSPSEVKTIGIMEAVRQNYQDDIQVRQEKRCVEMDIAKCPKAFVSAHEIGDKIMAYYCEDGCINALTFTEYMREPHIVYKLEAIRKGSRKYVDGIISHELAHHVFAKGSGERSFRKICEKYDGIGCDEHPDETTETTHYEWKYVE